MSKGGVCQHNFLLSSSFFLSLFNLVCDSIKSAIMRRPEMMMESLYKCNIALVLSHSRRSCNSYVWIL